MVTKHPETQAIIGNAIFKFYCIVAWAVSWQISAAQIPETSIPPVWGSFDLFRYLWELVPRTYPKRNAILHMGTRDEVMVRLSSLNKMKVKHCDCRFQLSTWCYLGWLGKRVRLACGYIRGGGRGGTPFLVVTWCGKTLVLTAFLEPWYNTMTKVAHRSKRLRWLTVPES